MSALDAAGAGDAAAPAIGPGAFVAVVGASGVGKDALMSYARERLADGAYFPRRAITRLAGAGEDFDPLTEDGFAAAVAAGAFALSWRAHGLGYGIPVATDEHVRAGRVVVVNVSRAVLEELGDRYERLVVVRITVSDEVRAARLHARRREDAADIAQRLTRADPAPDFPVDAEIRNDGTLAEGGDQLLSAIASALQSA
ncbi:MAG: phosphonate metabolism protein/1,5-bisphosphokinase (PRPP-forming) PhnN [Microbacteriaceae bacterium]|nr:phosphonate metabolism protein/1,5-bisphosphokinase (PRPP-forming) PhnN [Microbacteriaceae bacterium]MCL2795078.1 phosphonate metabolism protein/1,5-bisphosphokinase (PRPP-forming) PhnN [Microbacteriaceae bacterium]